MSGSTESSSRVTGGLREALGGLLLAAISVATVAAAFVLAYGEAGQLDVAPTEVAVQSTTPPAAPSTTVPPPTATATPSKRTATASIPTSMHTPTAAQPEASTGEFPVPPTGEPPTATPASVIPTCEIPPGWTPYTVQPGDTMFRLAQRTGATVATIQQANCLTSTSLFSGQVVYLPADLPTPDVTCGPPPGWVFYTVQPGDTLFNLSQKFGTTVIALQQANCLGSSTRIHVGGQIYVPPGAAASDTPTPSATPAETLAVTPTASDAGGPTPTYTPVPELAFSAADLTIAEGAGVVDITVTLTRASADVITVDYSTADGSATAGADYTATNGTLTFNPGETSQTFAIPIADDGEVENDETIALTLSNPGNGALAGINNTATVTITDNDPQVSFSAANTNVTEANTGVMITVALSTASPKAVSVAYTTVNGTATAGSDYQATSGTLNFAPNETTQTFTVTITDDSDDESDETIGLTLSNPTNATLGSPQSATITIQDDDGQPVVSHSAANYAVAEGTAFVDVTVTLSAASVNTITVNYTTNNGEAVAGSDFEAASGVLTFSPGETSKSFAINIIDDAEVEGAENFTTTLSTPTNATLSGAINPAIVTINDNDT